MTHAPRGMCRKDLRVPHDRPNPKHRRNCALKPPRCGIMGEVAWPQRRFRENVDAIGSGPTVRKVALVVLLVDEKAKRPVAQETADKLVADAAMREPVSSKKNREFTGTFTRYRILRDAVPRANLAVEFVIVLLPRRQTTMILIGIHSYNA